jgi:hypothetical protein
MTQVSVNDAATEAATPPRVKRPRRKPRVLIALSGACVALALGWFVALPWLLRNRVEAVLRAAGVGDATFQVAEATPWGSTLTSLQAGEDDALGIERLRIEYSPLDLWNGRLHALRLRGARLELRVRQGRVDLSPLTAFVLGKDRPTTASTTARTGAREMTLPLERITLVESTVVFQTNHGAVQIPVDLEVHNRSRDQLLITAHAGPTRDLLLSADVDLASSKAAFDASAEPGWTLMTLRSIWPNASVAVDGKMRLTGFVQWADGSPGVNVRLEVGKSNGRVKLAPAQLKLSGGVCNLEGQLGRDAGMTLALSDADMAGDGFAVTGVSGSVAFTNLSPPATPPAQRLTASSLEIGGMTFTDGMVEFQVIGSTNILVNRTEWQAFGGTVASRDVAIRAGEPIAATVHANSIELKELLATFAKDKASGEGKLTGELPIVVDGSNVKFGDGRAVALEKGRLQIKDAAALAPVAEGAAAAGGSASQGEQIKQRVVEALSDFEYDRLTARLESDGGEGLSAFVRTSGRGRTGARQALDYELRIHGLDGLLRSYFGIRRAMNEAGVGATTGKAETQ